MMVDGLFQELTMPDSDAGVEDVISYFRDREFDIRVVERDMRATFTVLGVIGAPTATRTHWADLISRKTGITVAKGYGSWTDDGTAVLAAKERWVVEQEGRGPRRVLEYAAG
jgi:hypothetical protein